MDVVRHGIRLKVRRVVTGTGNRFGTKRLVTYRISLDGRLLDSALTKRAALARAAAIADRLFREAVTP